MSLFSLFRRPKKRGHVSFTDDAVTHVRADGVKEIVRWEDLEEVGILTTDDGPMQEDVYFLLLAEGGKSGCVAPQSCEGTSQLLERLQKLPGFDNDAVIKAMVSASNARFVCWKRQPTRCASD
jgi:hypothetical protein